MQSRILSPSCPAPKGMRICALTRFPGESHAYSIQGTSLLGTVVPLLPIYSQSTCIPWGQEGTRQCRKEGWGWGRPSARGLGWRTTSSKVQRGVKVDIVTSNDMKMTSVAISPSLAMFRDANGLEHSAILMFPSVPESLGRHSCLPLTSVSWRL